MQTLTAQSQFVVPARADHVALGIAYSALAHLLVGGMFALLYVLSTVFPEVRFLRPLGTLAISAGGLWLLTLGLSQCVYLLPIAIYLRQTQRPRAAVGVLICVGIVFVLCLMWLSVLLFGLSPRFVG